MNDKDLKEMNSYKWWHCIELEPGLFTPGICPHGNKNDFESRWGLPKSLEGKTVLDIGTFNGLFAFECEKRNAEHVLGIDIYQGQEWTDKNKPFQFVKRILNSRVDYEDLSVYQLEDDYNRCSFDLTLFYGVLYHIDDPILALKNVSYVTNETLLLETAIAQGNGVHMEFIPGCANDPTNKWYPTIPCTKKMLEYVGFKNVELIDVYAGTRATFKATK